MVLIQSAKRLILNNITSETKFLLSSSGSIINSLVCLLLSFFLSGSGSFFSPSLSSISGLLSSLFGSFRCSLHGSLGSINCLLSSINLLISTNLYPLCSIRYSLQQSCRHTFHSRNGLGNCGSSTNTLQFLSILRDKVTDNLSIGFGSNFIALSDKISHLCGYLFSNTLNLFGICILNLLLQKSNNGLCLFGNGSIFLSYGLYCERVRFRSSSGLASTRSETNCSNCNNECENLFHFAFLIFFVNKSC